MTRTPHISTYHRDGIAVNVKDHTYWGGDPVAAPLIDELGETITEACYEGAREQFWEDARELAREYGYSDVFSMGRSGGWLGVMLNGRPVGDIDSDRWEQFSRFADALMPLLDDAGERFRCYLRDAMSDLEYRREANTIRSVN